MIIVWWSHQRMMSGPTHIHLSGLISASRWCCMPLLLEQSGSATLVLVKGSFWLFPFFVSPGFRPTSSGLCRSATRTSPVPELFCSRGGNSPQSCTGCWDLAGGRRWTLWGSLAWLGISSTYQPLPRSWLRALILFCSSLVLTIIIGDTCLASDSENISRQYWKYVISSNDNSEIFIDKELFLI